jgi:hypothetical protein
MHSHLRLTAPLLIFLALLTLAARTLGGHQTEHPALRGFSEECEGKPQPCWYGIVPGVTHTAEIDEALAAHGFQVRTGERGDEVVVGTGVARCIINIGLSKGNPRQTTWNRLYFTDCAGLVIGDLYRFMDAPGVAAWEGCGKSLTLYYPSASIRIPVNGQQLTSINSALPVTAFIVTPPHLLNVPDDFTAPDYRMYPLLAKLRIAYINAGCG